MLLIILLKEFLKSEKLKLLTAYDGYKFGLHKSLEWGLTMAMLLQNCKFYLYSNYTIQAKLLRIKQTATTKSVTTRSSLDENYVHNNLKSSTYSILKKLYFDT